MKEKHPGGRPTILTPELKAKAREYVDRFAEQGDVIPSAAGLACWLKISKSSIYNFGDRDAEFMDTLSAIQAKQEALTLNNGMTGVFNSTIAKLVLANHGYSDKVQQDHTSSDGSMTPSRLEDFYAKSDS
jgi:hypothetical protein